MKAAPEFLPKETAKELGWPQVWALCLDVRILVRCHGPAGIK